MSLAAGQLTVRCEPRPDGHATVRLAGEIDMSVAAELTNTLVRTARGFPAGVEVDLSEVAFCDCTGLAALIHACQRTRHSASGLVVRTDTAVPRVARLLALTRTCRLLSGDT
ncbi:STAS domain-containing protein [Kitasatospora sp. NPDC101155]|uniref:STAS domain-containing protein n=1 Tax=Kitasatospora sp. NPDC101155 TaxID=3364097 RepID=UPI00382ABD04